MLPTVICRFWKCRLLSSQASLFAGAVVSVGVVVSAGVVVFVGVVFVLVDVVG